LNKTLVSKLKLDIVAVVLQDLCEMNQGTAVYVGIVHAVGRLRLTMLAVLV
jgi:hypothetical protein